MEHDTERPPSPSSASDASRECIPSHSMPQIQSRHHASWSHESKSINQMEAGSATAASFHEGDGARHPYKDYKDLQKFPSITPSPLTFAALPDGDHSSPIPLFASKDDAPSPTLPFGAPGNRLPLFDKSNVVSMEKESGNPSSLLFTQNDIARNKDPITYGEERGIDGSISVASTVQIMDEHSITSSNNCVPIEGRLADLSDNESYSAEDDCSEAGEGGIVILGESTEEEYEGSMRESLESNSSQHQPQSSLQSASKPECIEIQPDITLASMYKNDSIVLEAAARVTANLIPVINRNESLDFEQLLQEAGDHSDSDRIEEEDNEEDDSKSENRQIDASKVPGQNFWQRTNPLSSFNTRTVEPTQSSRGVATRLPAARATRIRHDKYVVEIDIFPAADAMANSRLDSRDVMDIMANIELLHLWFDPVPAVFDATVKDGSLVSLSPRSSPSNYLEDECTNNNNRQYDGQWVEISTPPLTVPSDSRISGCLRAIRVSIRSMIGFPARIRSMVFVERSSGRIGMTLGPYPDGFLCNSGTMAYHTFKIRMNDEESGTADNRRCVVISDEVRLQRGGGDDDFSGRRRSCRICTMFRFLLGFLEWVLLFRWYQPDLASYMQQTISSLDKLRALVERGESAAYAGGEMIMEGNDWEGENANEDETFSTPLLG